MQLIGFNFEKISAQRNKELSGDLKINSNIKVKEISEDKIAQFKLDVLKIEFEFKISYDVGEKKTTSLAEINFEGSTVFSVDKTQQKEIMKQWKSKKIPENIRVPIYNVILSKSNIKALELEQDLNLPTHIPLPKINPNQQNNSYTG